MNIGTFQQIFGHHFDPKNNFGLTLVTFIT